MVTISLVEISKFFFVLLETFMKEFMSLKEQITNYRKKGKRICG
jgi:hypothetical protein